MKRPTLKRDGSGNIIFGKQPLKEELPLASYVYIWFHPNTGEPLYVGKGTGNRFDTHIWSHNEQLRRTIKKYGKENVPVTIVRDGLTHQEAFDLEVLLIKIIGRADQGKGPLVNHTDGGDGVIGYKLTPEQLKIRGEAVSRALKAKNITKSPEMRARISASVKATMATPEVYAKTSASQKARFSRPEELEKLSKINLGKKATVEQRAARSAWMRGHPTSDETKEKLRKAMVGYPQEAKDKISKANKGRIRSAETKAKLSEIVKKYWAEQRALKKALA